MSHDDNGPSASECIAAFVAENKSLFRRQQHSFRPADECARHGANKCCLGNNWRISIIIVTSRREPTNGKYAATGTKPGLEPTTSWMDEAMELNSELCAEQSPRAQ